MKPSYLRIRDELNRMIEEKQLEVGVRLPSEYEMASRFNVSRETFRAAVKLLEQEGKLLVKHGVGTFIIKPLESIPSSLEQLQSMGAMIRHAGMRESESRESIGKQNCRKEWAQALGLNEGDEVLVLERVRFADDEAVAFSINVMPYQLVGEAFENDDFAGSLFSFLEQHCEIYVARADSELMVPDSISPEIRKIDPTGSKTVMIMKQVHYDERNRAVLYSIDYMRNDVFRFRVRRQRG
ncbi:GntR family transcriptional regulator [Anoxynatronum buryatiense]|uniref:GntR family transcriptional regulator n=1 Tax=Anoxynatronum buryatiense TaxID=489973 RepID=A0AA45WY48_9CLOT|nr:GntR family transcriptional regulator [Anoxynatronum buryatiense]SMP67406.1 GntR family transcriptional regulator [Anoxynatronum buryatiense]